MKKLIILFVLFILSASIYAQTEEIEIIEVEEADTTNNDVFTVVEETPSFPGGELKLYEFLANNMEYPDEAEKMGITGIVYVNFIIEQDGSISNARILRDIGGGCGEEVLRVVNSMPKWNPGKQRGKTVRVQYNLPVKFTLEDNENNSSKE
jgi:protein TonB